MSPAPTRGAGVRATLQVAAAASSWGCWSLFLRPTELSAWETAPLMFLVTGLALAPLVRLDPVTPRLDRRSVQLLAANTICDAINVLTFFAAMTVTTVGVAVLTHYLAPLLVAVAAPWIDRERIRGARVAAIVATLGLALVLQPWVEAPRGVLLGAALGLISAVAYAANVFVVRHLTDRIGALRVVSWHSLLAGILLLPLASVADVRACEPRAFGALLAGILMLSAFGGCMFLRGLCVIGTTRGSMLTFMEPLVAVLVGWLAWGEAMNAPALLGGVLVLAAGVFVSLQPREHVVRQDP